LKLTDFLTIDKWIELETEIYTRSGLFPAVYNTKGIRITQHPFPMNPLCDRIKSTSKGQTFICANTHMNFTAIAKKTRQAVIEECDAGLMKIVVPIYFKDEFVGSIGGCGLIAEEGEIDSFLINKTIDMPEVEVNEFAHNISIISQQSIQTLVNYLNNRIKIIAG
jgi:ligand-binding sensor protein